MPPREVIVSPSTRPCIPGRAALDDSGYQCAGRPSTTRLARTRRKLQECGRSDVHRARRRAVQYLAGGRRSLANRDRVALTSLRLELESLSCRCVHCEQPVRNC